MAKTRRVIFFIVFSACFVMSCAFVVKCLLSASTHMTTATAPQVIRVGTQPGPGRRVHVSRVANDKIPTGNPGSSFTNSKTSKHSTAARRMANSKSRPSASTRTRFCSTSTRFLTGSSMGDKYGPMVVGRKQFSPRDLPRAENRGAWNAHYRVPHTETALRIAPHEYATHL